MIARMGIPVVAIIGRPNVGKSSLLNALARERISIVDPRPGITRDRVTTVIEHNDRYIELVDTGGIGIVDDQQLEDHVEEQIQYAIVRADAIVFVVDGQADVTPLDQHIAELLRTLGKPIVLAANKIDAGMHESHLADFYRLGCGEPYAVSALHGRGRTELLEHLLTRLPRQDETAPAAPEMKLAIVGKRNAGKSTLVNALAGENRVIVSEIPGTTRDAIDVRFEHEGRTFLAIDTAGVRKKSRMNDIDFYSYTRALASIRRADVVMHLIDSTEPISEVDLKLARAIQDEFKPLLLVINKWDLAREQSTPEAFDEYLERVMPMVRYAPLAFVVAATGENVGKAIDVALRLHEQAQTRVGTSELNTALEKVLDQRAPTPKKGVKHIKIYYVTQVSVAPPSLVFFCNAPELIQDSYRRFMENRLRELLPYSEVPLRFMFRPRQRSAPRNESAEERK